MNALQHLEAFCSLNGPRFYGLPVNDTFVELVREESTVVDSIAYRRYPVPFLARNPALDDEEIKHRPCCKGKSDTV